LVPNTEGEIYYQGRRIDALRVQGFSEKVIQRFRSIFFYGIKNIYQKNIQKINKFISWAPSFLQKWYLKLKEKSKQIHKDLLVDKFMRKKIQMVFQDPDASLNPRWKIVNAIGEPLKLLEGLSAKNCDSEGIS
jgi:ABC-type dipeptide/oligopeptide/nickel transport system ATPase component